MPGLNIDRNTLLLIIACFLLGMIVMSLLLVIPHNPGKKVIFTEKAPGPIGPYSQAVYSDHIVYTSGQIGIDPKNGNLTGTVEGQTDQVMKNLQEILGKSGLDFSQVLMTRIYLTNMSDFGSVNTVYSRYMGNSSPARSTIQVAGLPKGAVVEIEMIAHD
jgi:2-iminobutanoate/2-iminopropanoate deaminase